MGKNDDVLDVIRGKARANLNGRQPGGWYSAEGDCLFFYNEDVPYRAVRLTGLVTVFEALDDGRPVGIQVKGIRSLLRKCAGLQVRIQKGGGLELLYLLSVAITFSEDLPPERRLIGRTFESFAEQTLSAESLQAVTAAI